MKRHSFIIALLCMVAPLMAQHQFNINSFRVLSNDISAFVHPVKDLNDEACALIKVVANHDFVFSTPLGIVLRKNEVGEIWLYVPKSTKKMTIKHPKWGVLRDYHFSETLESRLTYELVLSPPIEPTQPIAKLPFKGVRKLKLESTELPDELPFPKSKRKYPREPISYNLIPNVRLYSSGASYGLRIGVMRRHGIYLNATSDFNKRVKTEGPDCDENGVLVGQGTSPYYTGKTYDSRYMLVAGLTHRIYRRLYLYEGIGYGDRLVAWETTEGVKVRNKEFSVKGLSAEIGGMVRWRSCMVSLGVSTISARLWEANIGIGIHF